MKALLVLIGALTARGGFDQCPWGLLLPAQYGQGIIIHRCSLLAGHTEPHYEGIAYPQESPCFLKVNVYWQTTKRLFPVTTCDPPNLTDSGNGDSEAK